MGLYFENIRSGVLSFLEVSRCGRRNTCRKLIIFQTDRGECNSREFEEYWSNQGISNKNIVPATPQHISVAKKMNHVVVENVRSMHNS